MFWWIYAERLPFTCLTRQKSGWNIPTSPLIQPTHTNHMVKKHHQRGIQQFGRIQFHFPHEAVRVVLSLHGQQGESKKIQLFFISQKKSTSHNSFGGFSTIFWDSERSTGVAASYSNQDAHSFSIAFSNSGFISSVKTWYGISLSKSFSALRPLATMYAWNTFCLLYLIHSKTEPLYNSNSYISSWTTSPTYYIFHQATVECCFQEASLYIHLPTKKNLPLTMTQMVPYGTLPNCSLGVFTIYAFKPNPIYLFFTHGIGFTDNLATIFFTIIPCCSILPCCQWDWPAIGLTRIPASANALTNSLLSYISKSQLTSRGMPAHLIHNSNNTCRKVPGVRILIKESWWYIVAPSRNPEHGTSLVIKLNVMQAKPTGPVQFRFSIPITACTFQRTDRRNQLTKGTGCLEEPLQVWGTSWGAQTADSRKLEHPYHHPQHVQGFQGHHHFHCQSHHDPPQLEEETFTIMFSQKFINHFGGPRQSTTFTHATHQCFLGVTNNPWIPKESFLLKKQTLPISLAISGLYLAACLVASSPMQSPWKCFPKKSYYVHELSLHSYKIITWFGNGVSSNRD